MAYEWIVTPDWHDTDVFTSLTGSISRSTTTARTGVYSFGLAGNRALNMAVSSSDTKYAGFGFYATSNSTTMSFMRFREGTTTHVTIVANTVTGTIDAKRGEQTGTLLGSGGSISANKWYYVGVKVVVDDSVGIVTVNLNGVEVIALTSQDTQNGGTGVIDNLSLWSGTEYTYFDDIKVRTDSIPGVAGLFVKVPTANGTDTGWTPSAGSAYECVDEVPATNADNIYTDVSTTGTKSTFIHGGLTATAYGSIDCVCVAAKAQLDDTGSGNIRTIIESNGSYGSGSSVALSVSPLYVHLFQETDPDTSAAWTKTGVNAAEPGVETI